MSRLIAFLKSNGESYINLEAEEFHQDGDFIVACNNRHETVFMARPEEIRAIWISEREKK